MTALSVDSAKNLAIILAIAFVVFAVVSAWVIKNVVTKVIAVLLLGGLALGVWTQRADLQDCANKAKEKVRAGDTSSITCNFFGTDVEVP